ncbi:hypothetical protein K450DRAFT_254403 [Umbelopsis ramanniana AG]|uniref:Uncharacterized protein n=1 Tax=Umbelopsis ramanniana AG TaxID=1314678 RepID=A0AAD5E4Z5_UMBRA|nr:uncharacterized protein K450DRAFT_254403 [Umbelopsis ramanniana AG]KAI8576952.1 hypothetical protein K450DRAFT_254403 [Umbelopsis ramanniana AG]
MTTISLRSSYAEITQWMIGQYVGRVMDDMKEKLADQSEERNMALIQELKDDIIKTTTITIPQLSQQIEMVASAQQAGEVKLKAELKAFFDEGKNSIVTDIGKIYRQCAEQIEKVQQQSDTTSEVMQELSASLKSLEEASVNATAVQDVKDSVKVIQTDMAKLASNAQVVELRTMTEDKFREQGERNTTVARRMGELKEMFAAVEEKTEQYNRRSQELDIVYDRIKAHIEKLKKGPDLKPTTEPSSPASQDVTRIQSDISTFRTVHTNLNAMIQAVGEDVKTIQAEQSRTTEKLDIMASSMTSGDVVKSLQSQIRQLHEKMMRLDKQMQISDQGSEKRTSETTAYQTQIPTNSWIGGASDHLNEDQLIANRLDAAKAIRYLEAKMVVNEQLVQNNIQDLQRDISNLRKRKAAEDGEPEAKHPRNDTSTPSHSDLQKLVDVHTIQLKDLISFLEPLKSTVLSNVFPVLVQKAFGDLINVSTRHEFDIKAAHETLARIVDQTKTDVSGDEWKTTAAQVFKLQLDSHERRTKLEHAELMEHVQKLKDVYAKMQEKEMLQQVQIDKLNQQLQNNTMMMETMLEALAKNGITVDGTDASHITHSPSL